MKPTYYLLISLLLLSTSCKDSKPPYEPVPKSLEYQSWEDTQQPTGSPTYLALGNYAKVLCSAVFVSGREIDEAAVNSKMELFFSEEQEIQYFLDENEKRVKVGIEGDTSRSATYYGDQGCILDSKKGIQFSPIAVSSQLPPAEGMDWPMGDRISQEIPRINEEKYAEVLEKAFAPEAFTAAFLVVKDGNILLEQYGNGAHKDMQLESWSMGKSLTATLIGRLMQMGELKLDQKAPIAEWQKEGDPRGEISIRQLLNMSSGLRFAAHRDPDRKIPLLELPHLYIYMEALDVFDFAVNRPLEYAPGSTGRYRNCDPLTLGKIVREKVEAMGENYHQWPQKELFDKIGIRKQVMETDIKGNFILTGFDYGTGRNWARMGMLYLNEGRWMGERLLPEGFTDFVSTPAPGWEVPEYGGQFWLNEGNRWASLPEDAYFMAGGGGQRVIISPSDNMVIVRLGHSKGGPHVVESMNAAISALMEKL
ncbi:MAG: serine hydrolase [Bacteroidia bacterium]|nr:serine hydrolase [Bacteroidia bacterium]